MAGRLQRIVTPLGEPEAFAGEASSDTGAEDSPLLRALGLAHHWQRLLNEGLCAGLREIAEAEDMDLGRASRIMRLTQLAPRKVEDLQQVAEEIRTDLDEAAGVAVALGADVTDLLSSQSIALNVAAWFVEPLRGPRRASR